MLLCYIAPLGLFRLGFYSGLEFPCADSVFVPVVAVHGGDIAVGIGVALPAAAVIDYIVDTSDGIFSADTEGYGVVFAVLGGGEIDGAKQWREEGSRRS